MYTCADCIFQQESGVAVILQMYIASSSSKCIYLAHLTNVYS